MLCQIVPEKCIACGLCQIYAPTVFDYTDDGLVFFKEEPLSKEIIVKEEQLETCLKAYQKCPTRAILLDHN